MNAILSDSRTIAALIGAVVVLAGWLFTSYRERRQREGLRAERIRDVQRALYAEIRAYVALLQRDELDTYREDMIEKMRGKDGKGRDFIPLIPHERNDTIFKAIVNEIHILPRSSIDPVALYYSQLAAISTMIDDLRSPEFKDMDRGRRIQMYSDYIDMKKEALALGEEAMLMIATYAKGGREAIASLNATRETISTPDADRSDP